MTATPRIITCAITASLAKKAGNRGGADRTRARPAGTLDEPQASFLMSTS
jgi:hypothetical protein